MASSITINSFNNEPFTRQLTATANGVANSNTLRWIYPSNFATAQTTAFNAFNTNTLGSAFSARVIYFSLTSTSYNPTTESYTLCTFPLTCVNITTATTAICSVIFDTFPAVDLNFALNYQTTVSSDYFYRPVSTESFAITASLSSTSFNTTPGYNTSYFQTFYKLNNRPTLFTVLSTLSSFDRPSATLSSAQLAISALSSVNSLSAFYTPHIFERSLSAIFVSFISASPFIAYPGEYFNTYYTREAITPNNLSASPGLAFYGEGHTEKIYLSAQPSPNVSRYVWKFGNFTDIYTPLVSGITGQLSSAVVAISSTIGSYPRIPIQLQATNSRFLSSDPLFYNDDITGLKVFYPYVNSTVDPYGNDLSTSKFFSSIDIKPYDSFDYSFTPGAPSIVYLPIAGTPVNYLASLNIQLTAGLNNIDPCFQLYGLVWRWLNFEGCLDPSTLTNKPSTWATTQCSVSSGTLTATDIAGRFRKKWTFESPLSADLFLTSPIVYSLGTGVWSLCTTNWSASPLNSLPSINPAEYSYSLRLSGYGTTPSTVSYFNNTLVYLNVQRPVTSQIGVQSYGQPSDWQPKTTNLDLTHEILSIPPPDIRFYTSNRYVLTGVPVKFENITTSTNLLCSLTIKFNDETPSIVLSSFGIGQSLFVTFSSLGQKSLTVTGIVSYDTTPITLNLPNIVEVVAQYDQVDSTAYRSTQTPLELPYPNEVKVAANDFAVADVFNSCVEKIYKNLEYLETRGKVYNGLYSDYFGWLGPLPRVLAPGVSSCPLYTWGDVNCLITLNNITWTDALTTASFVGSFASCGTWLQQTCGSTIVSPDCFQLYCTNWQWKKRKCINADIPITWKDSKCEGLYKKRWYFEPCDITTALVCDEGLWNVNIPRLDTYYDPLGNCQVQYSCNYSGVASRNNIIYVAQRTQIKVLSSDYQATPITTLNLFDEVTSFSNIKNVCLDSQGKIIVLDSSLLQVGVYTLNGIVWESFISWGGVGTSSSRSKFLKPNDIHVDQNDNIWVTDIGNNSVKIYSNTGSWINTIQNDEFKNDTPLSVCVDSQGLVHVLTKKQISVYDIEGNYIFSYDYKSFVTGNGVRINSSYNREIIYLCTDTQVLKFFRNGKFNGYIIQSKDCVNNITSVYQDEFRNVLITSNDKILKFPDLMTFTYLKGPLPDYYWSLEDLYIHPEEYIQNWVYNKSLQRLCDCIELFRSTVLFDSNQGICKCYRSPIYQKEDVVIGQNEIVTSTVVNRCLGYLWQNFMTLIDYFDPNCLSRYTNVNVEVCPTINIGPPIPFEPAE